MVENHSLTRLETNLHYWIAGPLTGPLIVFVHGATLDHRSFDVQLPPLVEAGYRVLTLDLRTHLARAVSATWLPQSTLSLNWRRE